MDIIREKILPKASGTCKGCGAELPGDSDVVLVPVAWVKPEVTGPARHTRFVYCTTCPVPEKPADAAA